MQLPKPEPTVQRSLLRNPFVVRLLAVALLAEIGYAVLNISTMPVYLKYDRGFGEFSISLVLVAFLLSEALLKGPMGHLADRIGRRNLMIFGPLLTVGTSLASLIVPHHWGTAEVLAFIALRILDGVGAALLWPAAFAAMSDGVRDHERQQAMSLLNVCYLLGVALALPVGGAIEDITGTKWASLILAACVFGCVSLVTWRAMPQDRKARAAPGEPEEKFEWREMIVRARTIPAYLLLSAVTYMGIGFPLTVIKIFAKDQLGMSGATFGVLVFPAAISMAVLSVPMSRYGERIGRARAVHLGMGLCAAGLTVIALGAFVPLLRSAWVLAIGAMPVGIGFLLAIPAWLVSVSDLDPSHRAANLGAIMTAQGIGAIVGAMLGGLAYEKLQVISGPFGRYSPFVGCAICVAAGWILALKLLQDRPHDPAEPASSPAQ